MDGQISVLLRLLQQHCGTNGSRYNPCLVIYSIFEQCNLGTEYPCDFVIFGAGCASDQRFIKLLDYLRFEWRRKKNNFKTLHKTEKTQSKEKKEEHLRKQFSAVNNKTNEEKVFKIIIKGV